MKVNKAFLFTIPFLLVSCGPKIPSELTLKNWKDYTNEVIGKQCIETDLRGNPIKWRKYLCYEPKDWKSYRFSDDTCFTLSFLDKNGKTTIIYCDKSSESWIGHPFGTVLLEDYVSWNMTNVTGMAIK